MGARLGSADFDLSLVVTTLGRRDELVRCLTSLATQTCRFREVVVVDQNEPGFLDGVLATWSSSIALRVVRSPRGAALGRNRGVEVARGSWIGFPDDDSWYTTETVAQVASVVAATSEPAWWTGRIVDADFRPVILRWPVEATRVTELDVWRTVSLASLFVRSEPFRAVGGFDERLGVGATSGLESSEEIDLVLRLDHAGFRGRFDPEIVVHHPADRDRAHPEQARRARRYGRGMGFVLAAHPMGWRTRLRFLVRPLCGVIISLLRGRVGEARYHIASTRGRLEGWRAGWRAPLKGSAS